MIFEEDHSGIDKSKELIMPYITFVIASRNDNYGGNLITRMENSLNSIITLSERHDLSSELIIVEWNPPPSKAFLEEELNLRNKSSNQIDIRFLQVPPKIHNSLPNSNKTPMFEYIAKNVGIRRARGRYVLATNPDIIFNDELFKFLSSKTLRADAFYRIDRHDVAKVPPTNLSLEEQEHFCKENLVMIQRSKAPYPVKRPLLYPKYLLGTYKRHPRKLFHDFLSLIGKVPETSFYNLHFRASGDFLLSARKNWQGIRGYPELYVNFNVDSLGVLLMASYGLQQIVLQDPLRIYHQPHTTEQLKRPKLEWKKIEQTKGRLKMERHAEVQNGKDWGLKGKI